MIDTQREIRKLHPPSPLRFRRDGRPTPAADARSGADTRPSGLSAYVNQFGVVD
jgi:hypothetical protein